MLRPFVPLVILTLSGLASLQGVGAGSDIVTVGLDMETAGNGPRSALDIDQCVSVAVGQPATIDVAVPEPGVPASHGVSAYQFTLFYIGAVVSVTADDHRMLLDEAPGSALIPISDAKPDTNGVYTSGAVDFGPKGIEPAGASETGPGVLARLTLTPHSAGVSGLVIKDVIIKDDAGDDIEIISVLSAHLYAGEPCPGQASTPTAAPTRVTGPSPAPNPSSGAAGAGPAPSPGELIRTGGAVHEPGDPAALLLGLGGLSLVMGAAALGAAGAGWLRL